MVPEETSEDQTQSHQSLHLWNVAIIEYIYRVIVSFEQSSKNAPENPQKTNKKHLK